LWRQYRCVFGFYCEEIEKLLEKLLESQSGGIGMPRFPGEFVLTYWIHEFLTRFKTDYGLEA
jgi:hypothetical protein